MTSAIEWDWYRSFLAVVDTGSLSAAARQLGLAQPTVGRHVSALEAELGQPLFIRTQAGLSATDAAKALRPLAAAMASTAAAIARTAHSRQEALSGVVRVTASEVIGVEVLPPILARLQRQHPGIVVELMLSNQVQDLLKREADIAVRMTAPQQEQLIARRVGSIKLGLHASEDYLGSHAPVSSLDDLVAEGQLLIGHDQETAFIRALLRQLPALRRERFTLRADSDLAHLALIRAGAGIGICQVPIARRSAALRRVLPHDVSFQLETWITMHEDLRESAPCRQVFDALVDGLRQHIESAGSPA